MTTDRALLPNNLQDDFRQDSNSSQIQTKRISKERIAELKKEATLRVAL